MFSEERAEAIAEGYREQIRLGLKTREEVFKEIEGIYRPDMQKAIKKRLEEKTGKKAETATFFFQTKEERTKAYNILAGHNFYFPYGPEISLKEIDDPDYMLELLAAGGFDTSRIIVKKGGETSSPEHGETPKEKIRSHIRPRIEEAAKTKIPIHLGYSYDRGELTIDREKYTVGQVSLTGFADTVKGEVEKVFGGLKYIGGSFREETWENERVEYKTYASFGYLSVNIRPKEGRE